MGLGTLTYVQVGNLTIPTLKLVQAVGIEQPAVHPVPTILERFRGQVSIKTRPKNTTKTRYRTFL
ncbi:MAG: hypothetical protein OER77_02575 [Myxococcales bacterium]|nr:hypothetical protein [Myxococcales bacterium]